MARNAPCGRRRDLYEQCPTLGWATHSFSPDVIAVFGDGGGGTINLELGALKTDQSWMAFF
jgi:hypothetical protein